MSPFQSAFLKYHSTQTVLHKMVDDWYYAINNSCMSGVLCLDLSKCFDNISHEILLFKLKTLYGFTNNELSWIESYLKDRSQFVKVDSTISHIAHVSIGIPQGSVLVPVLFLLFINDLPKVINNSLITMFADYVTLYATGNDVSHIQSTLQGDLECVLPWFRKNRLFVNPSKSSYLLVGTPQRTKHHSLLIKINGIILEQVKLVKLLGIYIDCNLTWKYHTTDLLKNFAIQVINYHI